MSVRADIDIMCKDCGLVFPWKAHERAIWTERGWPAPVRCPVCRRAKKVRVAAAMNEREADAAARAITIELEATDANSD